MNKNISLVTRDESTFLKGILILLIMVGHNAYLMDLRADLKDFLYAFHIHSFFYLTCMYNIPNLTWSRIKKDFFRLYVPYTLLFGLFVVLYYFLQGGGDLQCGAIFTAYFSGGAMQIANVAGFQYLWFLPAMFAFLFLRNVYFNYSRFGYVILVLSTLVLVFLLLGCGQSPDLPLFFPLGLYGALANFSLALLLRKIIESSANQKWFRYLFPLLFLLLALMYFVLRPKIYWYYSFCFLWIPLFAFPSLFLWVKSRFVSCFLMKTVVGVFIKRIGSLSFPIYLFHQVIYMLLSFLYSSVESGFLLWDGFVTFIGTLLLTLLFIYLFRKCLPNLYRVFS